MQWKWEKLRGKPSGTVQAGSDRDATAEVSSASPPAHKRGVAGLFRYAIAVFLLIKASGALIVALGNEAEAGDALFALFLFAIAFVLLRSTRQGRHTR